MALKGHFLWYNFYVKLIAITGGIATGKLRELNCIMHQKIKDEILQQFKELSAVNDEIFVEAAVLFEMNLDKYVDFVVVADCPDEIRIQRIISRDHLSYEEALKRINSQMPRSEYLKRADLVIDTSGDVTKTIEQAFEMLNKKPWCGRI